MNRKITTKKLVNKRLSGIIIQIIYQKNLILMIKYQHYFNNVDIFTFESYNYDINK